MGSFKEASASGIVVKDWFVMVFFFFFFPELKIFGLGFHLVLRLGILNT